MIEQFNIVLVVSFLFFVSILGYVILVVDRGDW